MATDDPPRRPTSIKTSDGLVMLAMVATPLTQHADDDDDGEETAALVDATLPARARYRDAPLSMLATSNTTKTITNTTTTTADTLSYIDVCIYHYDMTSILIERDQRERDERGERLRVE